jgi:cob(I)alamin adenosyltransferase
MYAEQGPNDELILEYLNKLSTLVYMLELSAMQEEID